MIRYLKKMVWLMGAVTLTLSANLPLDEDFSASFQPQLRSSDHADSLQPKTVWSFFHPFWRNDKGPTFHDAFRDVSFFAQDPEGRLEMGFKVPKPLMPRVVFWASIYARFNSRTRLIHDRKRPEIIYGVIDFNPLYGTMSETAAFLQSQKIETEIVAKLRQSILEIQEETFPTTLSLADQHALKDYLDDFNFGDHRELADRVAYMRTQSGQSDHFLGALDRARVLLPRMEKVLAQHGLPRALARIPFVESSFHDGALSKKGALGIWQFMPSTAKAFIHDNDRNRWRDPLSQTKGAAALLSQYRTALPDWGMVVTSYNSGIGRISKLRRASGAGNIVSLLEVSEDDGGLGFAGRNFYAEVLAANLVEAYRTELLAPAAIPAPLSMVKADLNLFPGSACWKPGPTSKPSGSALIVEAGLDFGDNVVFWLHRNVILPILSLTPDTDFDSNS